MNRGHIPRSTVPFIALFALSVLAFSLLGEVDRGPTKHVAWFGLALVASIVVLWPKVAVVVGSPFALTAAYGIGRIALISRSFSLDQLVELIPTLLVVLVAYAAVAVVARSGGRILRSLVDEARYRDVVIEELTKRDPDTNAIKAQYARQLLREEVERARRYRRPLSYIVLGIEDWTGLCKRQGVEEARSILARVSEISSDSLRLMDKLCRHGDAQFALILPETPLSGAKIVGERIIARAEGELGVTVRAGVVEFPGDGDDAETLIQEADSGIALATSVAIPIASRGLLSR